MNNGKLLTNNVGESASAVDLEEQAQRAAELEELGRQIDALQRRVEEHERRGRFWGTYEHQRLAELEEQLREDLEDG